jgi:hypothetical protein
MSVFAGTLYTRFLEHRPRSENLCWGDSFGVLVSHETSGCDNVKGGKGEMRAEKKRKCSVKNKEHTKSAADNPFTTTIVAQKGKCATLHNHFSKYQPLLQSHHMLF